MFGIAQMVAITTGGWEIVCFSWKIRILINKFSLAVDGENCKKPLLWYDCFMGPRTGLYLKIGAIVLALGFTYALAAFVVPRALVTLTKAAPASVISLADSRILGQKILAKADGNDQCIVNVFILDKNAKGVPQKQVVLEGLAGIEPSLVTTNAEGKAAFTITSKIEGTFKLNASVGGSPLPKEIKVTFRN